MSRPTLPIPGAKAHATLYDVCELSGVSSATVSRVFSGTGPVRDETRKRVMAAARRLAYEPSHAARALRSRRTQTLAAVFPEIATHFYPVVLAGIDEVAAQRGFDVLAAFVGKRRQTPELVNRLLQQGRVDAMILMNLQEHADIAPRALAQLPIVLIDRAIGGVDLPVIGMDNVGGAEEMIEHLADQGHRRIAILTGPAGNYDSEQRLAGCRRAMARLGLEVNEKLIWTGAFTFASGVRAARQLLRSRAPLPDGIFCLNDAMAIAMLAELRDGGVSVPGDVALAGFDNVDESAHMSLTTVAAPMRLMGQTAARAAVELVSGGKRPRSQSLPVRLVVRASSRSRAGVTGRARRN